MASGLPIQDDRKKFLVVIPGLIWDPFYMRQYYVYIMGNARPTLYVGVTNDLVTRVHQHKTHSLPGFTDKYFLHKLLYFEMTESVESAIGREKQIKAWKRQWKLDLIAKQNPQFEDLSERILNPERSPSADGLLPIQDDNAGVSNG